MFDSYGDGWNGNSVSILIDGEVIISDLTFDDGYSESVTFEATQGDLIELVWSSGSWEEEVSFEILDGSNNTIVSGEYGDTLVGENILAYCFDYISEWPTCAHATGYTLELTNPVLDNSIADNWNCINEFGSPNQHNSENLDVEIIELNTIKINPNPVSNLLYISGQSEKYNIEIFTLTGQKLFQDYDTSIIDMSVYENGVYLIRISDQNSTWTKQVIKLSLIHI